MWVVIHRQYGSVLNNRFFEDVDDAVTYLCIFGNNQDWKVQELTLEKDFI